MRVRIQILFLLISIPLFAGNRSDSVRIEAAAWNSAWRTFENSFEYNPAATFSVPVNNFSRIGASYKNSTADNGLYLVQEGNGASALKLHSESFQVDSKYRFFGKASFLSDQKNNVAWRDVEDYEILSPYLLADSIGGTYKRESYFLSGGATIRYRKMEFGIRASYQGGVSFRQVDPRPRNTVSVICINPGLTYTTGNWNFGWFGEYQRYRQNVDIQVEKEGRKIYFYLMQGFGIYNRQFSGLDDAFSRIYKGNLYSTGFHVNYGDNIQSTGALVSISQNNIQVVETSNRIPYRIIHNKIEAQLTHERELFDRNLFLKGNYSLEQTIGNETQYKPVTISATFIEWQYATQSDRYQNIVQIARFSALLADKNLNHFSMWEKLDVDWHDAKQNYYYPYYHQNIQNITGSGTLGINYPYNKSIFTGSLCAGYKKNLSSSVFQNENNEITSRQLLPDYDFWCTDVIFYQLKMSLGFPLFKSQLAQISLDSGLQTTGNKKAFSTNFNFTLNF